MKKIATVLTAATLGLGVPFAALAPAMAEEPQGYHRAELRSTSATTEYEIGKACWNMKYFDQAQYAGQDVSFTDSVTVKEGDTYTCSYYIVWND